MPYYGRGDYYQGDYYRGDPFLGGFIRKVSGAVSSLGIPGVSQVAGVVHRIASRPAAPKLLPPPSMAGGLQRLPSFAPPVPVPQGAGVPVPGARGAIQRFLPGGASGFADCPAGYHVNKAYMAYVRSQERGGRRQAPNIVNLCVRHRSMNAANPRALRRAMRREQGFIALARRALKGSGYTFKRTGVGGKKKKRR